MISKVVKGIWHYCHLTCRMDIVLSGLQHRMDPQTTPCHFRFSCSTKLWKRNLQQEDILTSSSYDFSIIFPLRRHKNESNVWCLLLLNVCVQIHTICSFSYCRLMIVSHILQWVLHLSNRHPTQVLSLILSVCHVLKMNNVQLVKCQNMWVSFLHVFHRL